MCQIRSRVAGYRPMALNHQHEIMYSHFHFHLLYSLFYIDHTCWVYKTIYLDKTKVTNLSGSRSCDMHCKKGNLCIAKR